MLLLVVLNGISGECNISVFWRDHFSSILNSSGLSNADLKNSIMSKLDDVQYSENMIVSSRVTSKLVSELDSGKSSGPDNISPESLKFASNRLSVLLSLCFAVCLSHGYLPPAMIKTTIVPIVKISVAIFLKAIIIDQLHLQLSFLNCLNQYYL